MLPEGSLTTNNKHQNAKKYSKSELFRLDELKGERHELRLGRSFFEPQIITRLLEFNKINLDDVFKYLDRELYSIKPKEDDGFINKTAEHIFNDFININKAIVEHQKWKMVCYENNLLDSIKRVLTYFDEIKPGKDVDTHLSKSFKDNYDKLVVIVLQMMEFELTSNEVAYLRQFFVQTLFLGWIYYINEELFD